MKILFVSDLDGTLLNQNDSLSQETIETIKRLQKEGMYFTYATARSYISASCVAKELVPSVPVIVYNGATILDASNGEVIKHSGFSTQEQNSVRQILEDCNLLPLTYSYVEKVEKLSYIIEPDNDGMMYYLNRRRADKRLRPVETPEELYAGEIFYLTCIGPKDRLEVAYQKIKDDARFHVTFQQELYRKEYWLEIMPAEVTKSNAIRLIKEMYGFDKIISFGDSLNDVPMFEISDEAYAVANAAEELKKIATGVIESNEDNGVARWLAYHWQEKKMLAGEIYDTSDKLLAERRKLAHRL